MTESIQLVSPVCKNTFEHFNSEGLTGFLENISAAFIDKTESQKPEKKRKLLDPHFKDHGTLGLKYS